MSLALEQFIDNMQLQMIDDEKLKLNKQNLNFQRWFYALISLSIVSVLLLLNYHQMKSLPKTKNHEFPIYLLFIIHSSLSNSMKNFLLQNSIICLFFNSSLCTHLLTINSYLLSYIHKNSNNFLD